MPQTPYGASVTGGAAPITPGTGPGSDFLPLLRQNLTKLVATNSLQAFYPPQRIEEVLARLVQVDFRCVSWQTFERQACARYGMWRVCGASSKMPAFVPPAVHRSHAEGGGACCCFALYSQGFALKSAPDPERRVLLPAERHAGHWQQDGTCPPSSPSMSPP